MPHEVDILSGGKLQHASGQQRAAEVRPLPRVASWLLGAALVLHAAPPTKATQSVDEWHLTIEASTPGLIDRGRLVLGSVAEALPGLDEFDEPHPPALFNRFLDLFTEHDQSEDAWTSQVRASMRYRKEYGPALGASDRAIEFIVEAGQGGSVSLTWDIAANLDLAQHFLTLHDLESGATVDMWSQGSYEFASSSARRGFRVQMTAGRSAPPVAFPQTVTLAEDASVNVVLLAQDPEGDELIYEIASAPLHGVLTGTGANLTYTPAPDYFGPDSFGFRALDSQGPSNVAAVSLAVTPVNDAPSALPQAVTTNEDEAAPIILLATDPDGDALTYVIVQPPSHGSLEGAPPNLSYHPEVNFGGADSFSFQVSDGLVQSVPALISVTVVPIDDPPRAAFTVPGEAANVANWDNNLGSFAEGANATASSQSSVFFPASNAIDDSPLTRWVSAAGQIGGETLTLTLPRGGIHRFSRVRLVNAAGTTEAVRHFEVRTSTATSDPAAFVTVLSDLALSDGRVQEFSLPSPAEARYVQLRALDNYGSASSVSVASFEVIGEDVGGVPSYSSVPTNLSAASEGGRVVSATSQSVSEVATRAIDGNPATLWTTATGQRTNQSLVVELAREKTYLVDRVALINGPAVAGQGVRNFRVAVSATTADEAAFVDVLSSVALNNATVQEFVFPGGAVPARYVRLTETDNYGSACCISLAEFQVMPSQLGGASFSSAGSASERVEHAVDASPGTVWRTAAGQVADQFFKIRLQSGREHLIDRVRLLSNGGTASLKDFGVLVSTTTEEDAAFEQVLSASLPNTAQLQEFVFPGGPVRARYVKLLAKNNYGGTSILVTTFQVVTASTEGSVISIPASISQLARNQSPALSANGALVLAFSSAFGSSTLPSQMLDHVLDFPWATNGLTQQFALIRLSEPSLLTGVRVSPRLDCCQAQSVKDFEVWTSDTTTDDGAFARALVATVQNNGTVQSFEFGSPVQARYVKYVPLSGYGDPVFIATTRFDVIAAGTGGVAGASSGPLANPPELALDGNPSTIWRTAAGFVSNQWMNVLLVGGGIHQVFGVRMTPELNAGPRAFEIRVSTTSTADADFVTVASGIMSSTDPVQEFSFGAVAARYVQFRWLSGYGASFIGVRELEVLGGVAAGALVRGVSSQSSTLTGASQALDSDTGKGAWTTASGQSAEQWMTLTLPGDVPVAIDRVALQGPATTTSPRDFDIQVSTTSADPAAFVNAFSGTLRNDGTVQNFFFDAAAARHLRLLVRTNYGGPNVTLQNFRVFSPEFGETQARFVDQSTAIDGHVTGRAWQFGDAAGSLERDPVHAYGSPGVYDVQLTASADTGLSGVLIRPYRAAARPVADLEFYPAMPREGQSVAFSDRTDDPSKIVLREWDFGDGAKIASAAGSVSHTYADNGTFTVTLKVTNSFGLFAATTSQVQVTNVTPTVTAGVGRRWVANDSIPFTPTIVDPGTDPPSCVWEFGDGTAATTCATAHTYLSPASPTDDPMVFNAVVTVNDGDGGVASAAVETTVFPKRLHVLSSGLTNPIGIDWSPDASRFVVSNRYPTDQLVTVSPAGAVSPVLVSNLGSDEVNLVVSPGLGGFARGDVYYNVGRNHQLGRLTMDAAGNVTQVESPWITQLNAATYGGITFDTEGGFGHDLLVVWQHGVIYRVNAAGQSTEIGRVSSFGEVEGATVAGPGLGPVSGCLLTVARLPAKVWAICPNKTPVMVADMAGLTGNQTSWIRYVPSPGSVMFTDYLYGRVLRGDPRVFGGSVVGHAVISTEYGGEVWDLSYDAASASFKTRLLALAPNTETARLEDITFVPAHGQLAPSTAVVAAGTPHTLNATVVDDAGYPVAGLPVTFSVSGTNPQSGTAITDDDGVATFSYTGVVSGDDTIVASSLGLVTNPASVTWFGNTAPIATAQTLTTPQDTAVSILLSGADAEGGTLAYTIGAPPQHGTLSGVAPAVTYVPAPGYFGGDSFAFTVTDETGATSVPSTVAIEVQRANLPPVANPDSMSVEEDGAVTLLLTGTDGDADALTFALVLSPQHGTLSGTLPNLVYAPTADFNGPDSLAFTVTDSRGATSAPATVSIVVTSVNDAPSAHEQSLTILEDTFASITLTGSDPDGDSLAFTVVAPPLNGLLLGTAPNLTYIPAANFNGADVFAFVTLDPSGATSAPATILITTTFVNDTPVADSESTRTLQGVALEITLTAHDIENDALTFSVVTPPEHGTLAGTAPNLTYIPADAYAGSDSFTFQVTDALGAISNLATISIVVEPGSSSNQPPVCSTATGPRLVWPPNHEMTPLSILGVTDPEGGAVTIAVTSIRQDEPLNGTGDGDMTPDATLSPLAIRAERHQNGNGRVYTIDFKALDPLGGSCLGVVKVCVPKSQSGKGSTCGDEGPVVDSTGGGK